MENNEKKIILVMSTVVIATIMLIGFSYAYYKTKISGNTKEKSISVTSKKLEVSYADGNGVIEPTEKIEPGYTATKTFTVENTGENPISYSIKLDNITNTFTRTEDWTYVLKKGETEVSSGKIPTNETYIVNAVSIDSKTTDSYSITVTYANLTDVDQSVDMGKSLSLRVNIDEAVGTIFESASEGTLLKAIGNDNSISKPLTVPGAEASSETEAVLASTEDDYGDSYYFRGNVKNNYVNFAGMCWRIVRVSGDGSVKMTLAAQKDCSEIADSDTSTAFIGEGNYGYDRTSKSTSGTTLSKMNYLNPVTGNTSSMVKAFYDFQTTKLASYLDKLKSGDWCLGDTAYKRTGTLNSGYTYTLLTDTSSNYLSQTPFYYDAYGRINGDNKDGYSATLKCNGTKLDKFRTVENVSSEAPMYVSTLTIDEVAYAGGNASILTSNTNYYLSNNASSRPWWALSPSTFDGINDYSFYVDGRGGIHSSNVNGGSNNFRPAVSLASSAQITSGNGTQTNPYIIK